MTWGGTNGQAPMTELTHPEPLRPDRRARRSRWAAVGAALAVSVGAGGALTGWAGSPSGPLTVFVPSTPCRLLDTRPATDNVGPRDTPLAAGETYVSAGRGAVGNCTIPDQATALSMNVAVINPSAASFLTVFPAGGTRPTSANLNWVAHQAPTPNAVTSSLSADGQLALFNLAGTVDVSVDVVGYYVPAAQAITEVSSDVVDLSRTVETIAGQVTALAAASEVQSVANSIPSNVTAQQSAVTSSVTTTTAGRWWITATYNLSATCSSGTTYLAFLLVDDVIVRSTSVSIAGATAGRTTLAGPTAASIAAGAHTVKIGAWCFAGAATAIGGTGNGGVVNVMVLR